MQTLFNLLPSAGQGVTRFPDWLYVREGLRRNLATVLRFARTHSIAVPSNHFLVTLLQSITVPQSHNLERYYDLVDGMALNLSMALKMTSSIYKGKVFYGTFYGPGNDEILIAHTEGFDYEEVDRTWWKHEPVKVLRHPMSDLHLGIPDGKSHNFEYGLSVITINIPMLAVMYRAFRRNEGAISDGDSERSLMHFVRMFVLPNMLASHLDIALFNRFDRLRFGAPLGESHFKHTFAMPDYSDRVDASYGKVVKHLEESRKNFTGLLKSIPAVTAEDMLEVMAVPDMPPTYQVMWALMVSRLPALQYLVQMGQRGGAATNQQQLNIIASFVRAYRSASTLNSVLPMDIRYDVEAEIASVIDGPAGYAL